MHALLVDILNFLSSVSAGVVASAGSFFAAGITVLEPLPGINPNNVTFAELLSRWYFIFVSIAAVLAFAMIVWGAWEYAISEATGGKERAKARIRNAALGLILMLASYLILFTIDPNLVRFNLSRIGPVGDARFPLPAGRGQGNVQGIPQLRATISGDCRSTGDCSLATAPFYTVEMRDQNGRRFSRTYVSQEECMAARASFFQEIVTGPGAGDYQWSASKDCVQE
jgi:hypothetical protein